MWMHAVMAGVLLGLIVTGTAVGLGWVVSWLAPDREEWKP